MGKETIKFTCNPAVQQLEWPSQAWEQMCLSGLCSSDLLGDEGQSVSVSARTLDYVGEIRQEGLSVEMGRRLDFLSDRAKPPHFPWGFFPAWLTDCPAVVMTPSKYISSIKGEREMDGWRWNQLLFYSSHATKIQLANTATKWHE